MKNRRRDPLAVHIPIVYEPVEETELKKRLPIEEVRRRWRRALAEVRKARKRDED